MLDELRRVIGFQAYAWILTDPQTAVGVAPVADVPWMAELPGHIRMRYLTPVNRWTALGDVPVALLHETTGGELAKSMLWRELLVRHGVTDAASMVMKDRFGCWGFLELWKAGGAERFTRAEATFLISLAAPLAQALRRCQANTFAARPTREEPRGGPVVLVLSEDLQVRGQTAETADYLRVLVPPTQGRAPIPAAAYNVAAQLLAVEASVDDHPPTARVHVSDGLWMTARAARLGSVTGSNGERDIAVTLEQSSTSERADMFSRAFGLTPRERELLGHLAEHDTRELARRMFLSENTVQDHLKAIFEKTATHSRRALLAVAHGI